MEKESSTDFQFGPNFDVSPEMKDEFDRNGFIIIRGLFDKEEVAKLNKSLTEFQLVENYSYGITDRSGKEPRVLLWTHPGNDVTGMVPRCEKIVTTCEKLMGGDELYHYHTKIMMKDPQKGGSFEWHQDYGYWYKNGCLTPDLISMFMAIDPCVKENGGLRVLVGSHKCGRIDHTFAAGQTGADLERVKHIEKRFPLMYVNLQPAGRTGISLEKVLGFWTGAARPPPLGFPHKLEIAFVDSDVERLRELARGSTDLAVFTEGMRKAITWSGGFHLT